MSVTLREVAQRAGVSTRTVSNVVNDFRHVAPDTRAKVQAALDELNYRPNLLARSLRQGRTGIVTVLLPELRSPYFGELAHELVDRAREIGFTVMIDETGGDEARERALLDVAAQGGWVDGVLLSSVSLRGDELAAVVPAIPVVLLGERTAGTALDHVAIDNVAAADEAVSHLIDSGRRRIVALGGRNTKADTTSTLRLKGYRRAMRRAGLGARHVSTKGFQRVQAADAVERLLDGSNGAGSPDAVFCFSDELAVGVLRALASRGLRVPADLAVVGFDDVEDCLFTTPSLTSVRPDKKRLAAVALELLIARIDGGSGPARDVRVDHELVVRESSSPPRRGRRAR